MKKRIFRILSLALALIIALAAFGCVEQVQTDGPTDTDNVVTPSESEQSTQTKPTDIKNPTGETEMSIEELVARTAISPTIYDVDEIKTAEKTTAGSFEAWRREVVTLNGNNDDPTDNTVIKSPFHSLYVNDIEVPVYTARCATGAHSFAWVELATKEDFALRVELLLSIPFAKCQILPMSRGISPTIEENVVSTYITEANSYTYTFSADANAKVTDPTLAPLTLMVTAPTSVRIPSSYKTVEIEPGRHADDALEFTEENTVYIIKKGFHDVCSIGLPSNSRLIIEQGAYIKATERRQANGSYNTKTVIHADDVENVIISSRGLVDCGALKGGDNKNKHVVNVARSKNVRLEGLTIVNSNTWTICAYNSSDVNINRNLLLGYRMYSDGIMMSECKNSAGRYNFVRTGDDAIEFKGTGWWNGSHMVGENCTYEYNDLWTDKGAGYCLTWESACSMKNMTFRKNSVGFAQPTWTNRNTAIDCLLGSDSSSVWSDILFEDIEIYHVFSPNAINLQIHGTGGSLKNITYRNIDVYSAADKVCAYRMHFSAKGGEISNITLEDMTFCGVKITNAMRNDTGLFKNEAGDKFAQLTIISKQ